MSKNDNFIYYPLAMSNDIIKREGLLDCGILIGLSIFIMSLGTRFTRKLAILKEFKSYSKLLKAPPSWGRGWGGAFY